MPSGGSAWKSTRHDKYYNLAKEQGYRSRAAYKIIQINKKYNFLSTCKSFLDLGAAPGGWLQVAVKTMPMQSLIIGVDLLPIKPIKGCVLLQQDITTQQCASAIKRELNGWSVDVVVHDGAPNVAGGFSFSKDAYNQNELVLHSLALATKFLRSGGYFVTKVFRSQDYNSLLWVLKHFFKQVEINKPPSSRAASAEIFVVCLGYLAPKSIDPRLLDPTAVFQHFDSLASKTKVDVFNTKNTGKKNRQRGGYDDDVKQSMNRECSVNVFVDVNKEESAIEMLGAYTAFVFNNNESEVYKSHTNTNDEVLLLLSDLRVLGKGDFKNILKWRKMMRVYKAALMKQMQPEEDTAALEAAAAAAAVVDETAAAEAAMNQLDTDIDGMNKHLSDQQKKTMRKRRELKAKQRRRMLVNIHNANMEADSDVVGNSGLFSVNSIVGVHGVDRVHAAADREQEWSDDDGELHSSDDDDDNNSSSNNNDNDDYEDVDTYYQKLESQLDNYYESYRDSKAQSAKRALANSNKLDSTIADEDSMHQAANAVLMHHDDNSSDDEIEQDSRRGNNGDSDSGDESNDESGNEFDGSNNNNSNSDNDEDNDRYHQPLVAQQKDNSTGKQKVERWFSRGIFGASEELLKENQDADDVRRSKRKSNIIERSSSSKSSKKKQQHNSSSESENSADSDDNTQRSSSKSAGSSHSNSKSGSSSSGSVLPSQQSTLLYNDPGYAAAISVSKGHHLGLKALNQPQLQTAADGKPVRLTAAQKQQQHEALQKQLQQQYNEDNDDGFDVVAEQQYSSDDDAVAERLALGALMLGSKRQRTHLIDDGYNRYTFSDEGKMPDWFVDDEQQHNTAMLPVTAQQVSTIKARLIAINARPIKKIAEAKARKKIRAVKRWEKVKQQADTIMNAGDTSSGMKIKQIEQMMIKQHKSKKGGSSGKQVEKQYIVSKHGGGQAHSGVRAKKGAKVVKVDRRMKADKRGAKLAARRNAEKSKGKGAKKQKRGH